jgi:hypothetical protein
LGDEWDAIATNEGGNSGGEEVEERG